MIHFNIFFSSVKTVDDGYHNVTQVDSIVVLTGDRFRIAKGLELLSQNLGSKLLLSGVNKNITLTEIKNAFPNNNKLVRTFQYPKFGIETITDFPIRNKSFKTLSGL